MTTQNGTREKLKGTPFETAEELKEAQTKIHFEVWQSMERSKAIKTLAENSEYAHFYDLFSEPWRCFIQKNQKEIASVELYKKKIPKLTVNESLFNSDSKREPLEAVLRTMLGEFMATYMTVFHLQGSSSSQPTVTKAKKK